MKKSMLAAILLSGCGDLEVEAVRKVSFYREPKSQLCFASGSVSTGDSMAIVFSWVPCDQIPSEMIISIKPEK